MIKLIHGDDVGRSRSYFQELKQGEKSFLSFVGGKFTLTDLIQNIEGSGLFSDTKNFFIEDLFASKKKDNATKSILKFIADSSSSNFVLWESKELSKRDYSILKNAEVLLFKLPKNIFLLLDSLRPNNSSNLLRLFHQSLESGIKEELVLFMMQRQLRILLTIVDRGEKDIDEVVRLASWQMGKLQKQANLFDKEKLKYIYQKLFEIEKNQKTGKLNLSLSQSIDFLLMDM